jgi:hypothetical protein
MDFKFGDPEPLGNTHLNASPHPLAYPRDDRHSHISGGMRQPFDDNENYQHQLNDEEERLKLQ